MDGGFVCTAFYEYYGDLWSGFFAVAGHGDIVFEAQFEHGPMALHRKMRWVHGLT